MCVSRKVVLLLYIISKFKLGDLNFKADDTQSRFRRRKSAPKIGADFWTVCHTNLAPVGADRRRFVCLFFC